MKTTVTPFILLMSLLLTQAGRCYAAPEEELLKLDSVVVSNSTKYEYVYNQQGQLIREKFFLIQDTAQMIFTLLSLTEYHYENGRLMSSVNSYQSGESLTASYRTIYEYDGEKLNIKRRENYVDHQWYPTTKSAYFYRNDDLLQWTENSVFTNGDFLVNVQAVYYYDEQSKELLQIIEQIRMGQELWIYKNKTGFDYENGQLIRQTDYSWNDTISDWKAMTKKEFIYDNLNRNRVVYKESSNSDTGLIVTLEKEITLDSSCPAKNLILPRNNNLPYKVLAELNKETQQSSSYFYSKIKLSGINLLDNPVTVSVYPNPAKDVLHIRSNQPIDVIEVFDVSGRLSATYTGFPVAINISNLTRGVYYLKINRSGQNSNLRFIKN